MELRQLTYFLAVAQTQSFRKAAEVNLVAESALSRQISALETELGVELFERAHRRVFLTDAGRELATYAKAALEQLQQAQQVLTQLKEGERGTIMIGCVEALTIPFLSNAYVNYRQLYPNVRLQVTVRGAAELLHLVEQGVLDFGILFDPSMRSDLLVINELFRQPLHLIVSLQHPLAQQGRESVTLEEVAHEPLVVFGSGYRLRHILERIYTHRGLKMDTIVEIDSVEGLKEFVKRGVGITLMPLALLRPGQLGTDLAAIPVSDLREEFRFALVYRRTGTISRLARAFIEVITASIKQISNGDPA